MDFFETINQRRSVRSFSSNPIPTESLHRIELAIQNSPSACNIQPYRFIFISNNLLKNQLAVAANNQNFIENAPLIIVGCGNPVEAYAKLGGDISSWTVDVAIAFEHLVLSAATEGLGTCWIGSFKEKMVKDILDIPEEWRVLALTPLGYPAKKTPKITKKTLAEIINQEKFSV